MNEWIEHEDNASEEWADAETTGMKYVNRAENKVRLIQGFTDSADRAPCFVAYRFADVVGMVLVRII